MILCEFFPEYFTIRSFSVSRVHRSIESWYRSLDCCHPEDEETGCRRYLCCHHPGIENDEADQVSYFTDKEATYGIASQ